MTKAKVELGRRLFYDADLSANGTMSCGTCHEQHRAFTEGNATHPGVTGERGRRNVPGLANVAWFTPLTFADAGQTSLEKQASVPVLGTHPVEMGMAGREGELVARLAKDDCYRLMFRKAFPETRGEITLPAVTKALAAFERTLVSYGSAYDYKRLSPQALAGRTIFAHDCASCHVGPNFTDLAYHQLGSDDPAADDLGLSETSGEVGDRGKFRTPSLRNVSLTAPYWHDGSARTLEAAIDHHHLRIAPSERSQLVSFLATLTDTEFLTRKSLALPMSACGRRL
jgi:cytochrome c peroxidase